MGRNNRLHKELLTHTKVLSFGGGNAMLHEGFCYGSEIGLASEREKDLLI